MNIRFNRSQQKFLFLFLISIIYTTLLFKFDFLQAVKINDEPHFWETSLTFSKSLIPSIENLRDYQELNTPLPFMIFGALEYFFHQGVFAGRLLNLILSLTMAFIIGWPTKRKGGKAVLCLLGLLTCPYYLLSSVSLVTDIIACFFVLLGFVAYVRNRHFLSSIAFILAIASRQYMLAFPVAIACYELIITINVAKDREKFELSGQWRWIAPLIASMSIFGWIYLFQGLAPATGIEEMAPTIQQQSTWFLKPNRAIYFLAFSSVFIVIPEFFLFKPLVRIKLLKKQWKKVLFIAAGLLMYCIIFPPPTSSEGMFSIVLNLLHYEILKITLFYFLSLLACVRFFYQPNLMFFCVLFNCIIMMKAHYWSKYVLPLAVVFWFLKSWKSSVPKTSKVSSLQLESSYR